MNERGFVSPTAADLWQKLASFGYQELRGALEEAGPGQRMRVTSLPEEVMEQICVLLKDEPLWTVRVLVEKADGKEWHATATKLIELRNTLTEPLLVFIPAGLRTPAADSLDVATFNELSFEGLSKRLVASLFEDLSPKIRERVKDALNFLRVEEQIRNVDEEIDYLLAVAANGGDAWAAGGALFRIGLVPDFQAFEHANSLNALSRNVNACQKLSDLSQPLQVRIARLGLEADSIQGKLFSYLRQRSGESVRSWSEAIACDAERADLSFEKWPFAELTDTNELRLVMEPLTLPMQVPDEVTEATPVPVLDLKGRQGLKLVFRPIPRAVQVPYWTHFRFHLFAVDGEQPRLAWESNSYKKPNSRQMTIARTIRIDKLDHLEEGIYFAKVEAYDKDGNLLTGKSAAGDSEAEASPTARSPEYEEISEKRQENESDPFLVVRGRIEVEPPEPRAIHVASLLDAWTELSARALGARGRIVAEPDHRKMSGKWRESADAPVKGDVHFGLEQGVDTSGFTVLLPGLLRRLELEILSHPEPLAGYEFSLKVARLADVRLERRELPAVDERPQLDRFLAARRQVFDRLRSQHLERGEGEEAFRLNVVETADLLDLTDDIDRYAVAYRDLAETAADDTLLNQVLAQLDVVGVRWPRRSAGDPRQARLLAPTHPLRLLWHLEHAAVIRDALAAWGRGTLEVASWQDFLKELRSTVLPTSLPLALFDRRGTAYVDQGPLTPFWSLYLPDTTPGGQQVDAPSCREFLRGSLGIKSRGPALATVDSAEIAQRLFDYVQQHAYVEQLCLNVFNAGSGALIADTLRGLEQLMRKNRDVPALRYSVQLFSADEHPESLGGALEALLDPDRQVGEDDEFALRSSNPLLPKLIFSRNPIRKYLEEPGDFTAHVSIFVEQFHVRGRVGHVGGLRRGTFVRGLVLEPETSFEELSGRFGWRKGLRVEVSRHAGTRERLLGQLTAATQRLQATVAGRRRSEDLAPIVELQLDGEGLGLVDRVHRSSDWVLTLDRHLGLEYYDRPASERDAGYLLDFSPEYLHEDRQRLMLTTRSSLEIAALLRPPLVEHGLELPEGAETAALEPLRSLSGRLALRLLSSGTRASEIVGLLLARLLLGQTGKLVERLVIPVDAHPSWFRSSEEAAKSRRADLLLIGFDPAAALLRICVVEVKMRESVTPGGELYRGMREQAEATVETLRRRFDPEFFPRPRADALFRAKELTTLLTFYVQRGERYGLFEPQAAAAALDFVQNLDAGYRLEIETLGVIFERQSSGSHLEEEEPGFPVYRFGLDAAQSLLSAACQQTGAPAESTAEAPTRTSDARFEEFRSSVGGPAVLSTADDEEPLPPVEFAAAPAVAEAVDQPAPGAAVEEQALAEAAEVAEPAVAEGDPAVYEPVVPPSHTTEEAAPVVSDILVGAHERTPQYGLLGRCNEQSVAIDLTGCNTISLFGVQGFGKSYTLGVVAEMASEKAPGINVLPSPLATVIFHYHKSDAYAPEYASAVAANSKPAEVERLREEYGASPRGLSDVVLLTPEAKVDDRREEFPGVEVRPIKFGSGELGADSWKFLMGAYGNDSLYVRQLVAIMRRQRSALTLDEFRRELAEADLPKGSRRLAEDRIRLAEPYIDDGFRLSEVLRPGRTVIVDLRDEWIEKDEALGLFVVMLEIFGKAKHEGKKFNKLVVFDEAHKYISESELIGQVVEIIREMRHHGTSVVIASQDPLSVPRSVIELSTILLLHRMTSPQWFKHLKGAITALEGLTEAHLSSLQAGEALLWAQRSTDKDLSLRPRKIKIRPRFTHHGGGTKTAVSDVTIR